MTDPQDLPLKEMSLSPPASHKEESWRESLWLYMGQTHRVFHTVPDYHNAVCLDLLRYPHWRECLNDWSKN